MPAAKQLTKGRLRALLNSLGLAPLRRCQSLHSCCLCDEKITLGQDYRDRGYGRRAHETCLKEANRG